MSIERLMNEYEGALFSALTIVTKAIRDLGVGRAALAAKFRDAAQLDTEFNRESAAAILKRLGDVAEGDAYYVPIPPFSVIRRRRKRRAVKLGHYSELLRRAVVRC
jgi:hypothetical protein